LVEPVRSDVRRRDLGIPTLARVVFAQLMPDDRKTERADSLNAAEHLPGEVVSKRELLMRVWPDTVVVEAALRVHMASLRRALGIDAAARRRGVRAAATLGDVRGVAA
jgi:DNA-binding response OmpR family regulator